MDGWERLSSNKAPLFDGNNYALWIIRMQTYMMALGFDVWHSIVSNYTSPKTPPTDTNGNKLCNNNVRAMNTILCGLSRNELVNLFHSPLESIFRISSKH